MRLKRLELQGFKSFLDRTILTFEPGITGVVGPNGCGKSNIVDAIQWVMGEQSAKHLRGESMTDVIFNGSDTKAATSMAEVTLVLDRMGVALSPQFAAFDKAEEIAITRRVYRDGSGEFLINKSACRLKDIHELFMDTGVGRRAYSIIEQGQIDRMINVKPEDRRYLFEEVAGITKYKAKRKEAERKLEMTRQNLLRLQDILGELEKQIRSLKVQATRARKYKELKGELEGIDLFLLGRNLYTHQKTIRDLEERREALVNARSESDALFGQMDAQVTELEILRIDQEKTFQQLGEKEHNLSLLVQKLENQINLYEERRKHLNSTLESGIRETEEIGDQLHELQEDEITQQNERGVLAEALEKLASEVTEREQRLRQQQEKRARAAQQKQALSDKKMRLSHSLNSLETQRTHGAAREEEITGTRGELEQKIGEIVHALEVQRQNAKDAETKIEECAARGQQTGEEVAKVSAEVEEISRALSQSEEKLFQTREVFHSRKSRLESLEELQQNLEGYSPTAREILLQLDGTSVAAVPLAEVLQPEVDIEDSIEALLGNDMNALIVKTTEEAETLSRSINEKNLERARILALSELAAGAATSQPPSAGEATPLLSKIKVREGYEVAAERWLGNAYLVSDAEALFRLRAQYPNVTFLTPDTRTIGHDNRTLSSGNTPTKTGVFARKRELEELKVACVQIESKLAQETAERENLLLHLQSQEQLHADLKDKLSKIHIESVEFRTHKEKLHLELNRTERDYTSLTNEIARNRTQLEDVQRQMIHWAEEITRVTEEQTGVQEELVTAEAEIEDAARDFEALGAAINEARVEKSRLQEKQNSLEYRLEKIQSDIEQLVRRKETIATQQVHTQKELEQIASGIADVNAEKEGAHEERNSTLVRITDVKAAFDDTCTQLQDLRQHRNDLQKKRETIGSEIQEVEIHFAQESASLDQLKSISQERYQREATALDETAQIDIEQLPIFAAQLEVGWNDLSEKERHTLLQEHLKNLKDKVARYGEVNLTAIQEFDEIQKRFDFLMEQKTDLEKSIGILEEAIVKIDESTKKRFEETFDAVNIKFKEIFPILFNGGKAELTLTNQDNMLEAGVDILVHPPGKRPASITLLSGGEKALTAVSLILAIFARKPSPFCLLDEVDAPLDDANVSRFNTVVRKMAEKTQFILITHNKKTMECAEALYGVTMERAGISKMTSVRLH